MLRLFRGQPGLLRFEGDGVCVTLDCARSARTLEFLETLDLLAMEAGAIPNRVKGLPSAGFGGAQVLPRNLPFP